MSRSVETLIEAEDFNALLRVVDAACEARAWEELVGLADRCEEALERGKQMWPIAAHVDYRLALEAPGEVAALALHPDVGRFAHGPLTEVVASTHTWGELADHIDTPQIAAYVAQERVLRGEVLTGDPRAHPEVLELPLELQTWEPTYALATFRASYVEVAEPWEAKAPLHDADAAPGVLIDDPDLVDALTELVHPWIAESNGAARAVVVEGDAVAAIAHLTLDRVHLGPLSADEALQRFAWAAASGGAHGRRRGAALGRFLAWYTAALVAGASWPVDAAELPELLPSVRWYRWDEGAPEQGWALRAAVENSEEGWAAAIGATDLLAEGSASAPSG